MKHALVLAILLGPLAARAQDNTNLVSLQGTNRFIFSARFGLNISAHFKGLASLPAPGSTRTTSHGDNYNYDDGYVFPDISGSSDGLTWYWGYDNSQRQINPQNNTILMSRSAVDASGSTATADNQPSYGAELVYQRVLATTEKYRFGIEAAANYLNLSLHDDRELPANLARTTYPFGYTPGTSPPDTVSSGQAYQGSYEGPGFVINANYDTPINSVVPGGASIVGHRQFDADLWGFRLGPFLELPMGSRFNLGLSAGLAGGWLDGDASWNEAAMVNGVTGPSISGSGHGSHMLWGFYAEGDFSWQFAKRWSAVVAAQYQDLGKYNHSFGGREVEVNLRNSVFFTAGISWSF